MNALTVITGASSNHFKCLKNLLASLGRHEPNTSVVIFDLGLRTREISELEKATFEVRRFPFEQYPQHVNIRRNRGSYAWKPIIIEQLLRERKAVLWLDAGNLVLKPFDDVRQRLEQTGFCSPSSNGTLAKWTHPSTLKYLGVATDSPFLSQPNRNAAIVGLESRQAGIPELAGEWKRCALDPKCIAPPGSSLSNHRYDQAILSVLACRRRAEYDEDLLPRVGSISTHNDNLTAAEACLKTEPLH